MTKIDQFEKAMQRCLCRPAEWVGRVETGEPGEASTWVCGLEAHRSAAEGWVEACTGKPARFVPRVPA